VETKLSKQEQKEERVIFNWEMKQPVEEMAQNDAAEADASLSKILNCENCISVLFSG